MKSKVSLQKSLLLSVLISILSITNLCASSSNKNVGTSVDLSIDSLYFSNKGPCYTVNESVYVLIHNIGDTVQYSFQVKLILAGAIVDTLVYVYNDSIQSNEFRLISFQLKTPGKSDTLKILAEVMWMNDTNKNHNIKYVEKKISIPPIIELEKDINLCIGDSILLDAKNEGCTYLWSNGDTTRTLLLKSGGTYWVEVRNPYGCSTKHFLNVTQSIKPNSQFTIVSQIGKSISFQALQLGGCIYLWDFGDPQSPNNTSQLASPTHTFTDGNIYIVTLKITDIRTFCSSSTSNTIIVFWGINATPPDPFNLKASPNPFESTSLLSYELVKNENWVSLEIYDLLGRKISTVIDEEFQLAGKQSIAISNNLWPNNSSMYLAKLNINGTSSFIKLISHKNK